MDTKGVRKISGWDTESGRYGREFDLLGVESPRSTWTHHLMALRGWGSGVRVVAGRSQTGPRDFRDRFDTRCGTGSRSFSRNDVPSFEGILGLAGPTLRVETVHGHPVGTVQWVKGLVTEWGTISIQLLQSERLTDTLFCTCTYFCQSFKEGWLDFRRLRGRDNTIYLFTPQESFFETVIHRDTRFLKRHPLESHVVLQGTIKVCIHLLYIRHIVLV